MNIENLMTDIEKYGDICDKKQHHEKLSDEEKRFKRKFDWITSLAGVFLGIAVFVFLSQGLGLSRVSGLSMFPTYEDGQIVKTVKADFDNMEPGSVVIAKYKPEGYRFDSKIIKRVIAVPGDIIDTKDGFYFVNDQPTNIPVNEYSVYVDKIVLADDEYFIVGDNYDVSLDSRIFGPIKTNKIIRMIK